MTRGGCSQGSGAQRTRPRRDRAAAGAFGLRAARHPSRRCAVVMAQRAAAGRRGRRPPFNQGRLPGRRAESRNGSGGARRQSRRAQAGPHCAVGEAPNPGSKGAGFAARRLGRIHASAVLSHARQISSSVRMAGRSGPRRRRASPRRRHGCAFEKTWAGAGRSWEKTSGPAAPQARPAIRLAAAYGLGHELLTVAQAIAAVLHRGFARSASEIYASSMHRGCGLHESVENLCSWP